MTEVAKTIECRMLCASGCAYEIDTKGVYTPLSPYSEGVGWISGAPLYPIFGGSTPYNGHNDINACLVGVNNDDGIIIAFRGTLPPVPVTVAGLADWYQDIFLSKPESENKIPGKVHHGFWDAIETLWTEINEKVTKLQGLYPGRKLYLTGHSKGGPMATISAARIHFDQPDSLQPTAVYTYASPHPGDTDFVANFPLTAIPVTRYENHLDIVPFIPPTEAFIKLAEKIPIIGKIFKIAEGWDYASLGTLQYIKKNHKIIDDNSTLKDIRIGELVFTMLEGKSGFEKIADAHSHLCGGGYMGGTCPSGICQ